MNLIADGQIMALRIKLLEDESEDYTYSSKDGLQDVSYDM